MTREDRERRGHKRFQLEGVRGKLLFSTDARVLDMSLDGIAIETISPLKVGRQYVLKLEENGQDLPMRGVVVWCSLVKTARNHQGEVQPVYRAGIHLDDLLTTRARELRTFIRKNAVIGLESRLFGRFRIEPHRSADLSFEADFRVLQISRSGMLVETDTAPPTDSPCQMRVRLSDVEFSTMARITRVERLAPRETEDDEEMPAAPVLLLGIEFLHLGRKTQEILESFIETELS